MDQILIGKYFGNYSLKRFLENLLNASCSTKLHIQQSYSFLTLADLNITAYFWSTLSMIEHRNILWNYYQKQVP